MLTIPSSAAQPWSRLTIIGTYTLDRPLRLGVDQRIFDQMRDQENGTPIVPAATVRGALRSAIRAIACSWESQLVPHRYTITVSGANGSPQAIVRQIGIACDSIGKNAADPDYQGCLTDAIAARWQADPLIRAQLPDILSACTCSVCRLFGTPWLAGRVRISDLIPLENSTATYLAGQNGRSGHLIFPASTRFRFKVSVDQADYAEHGLILIGIDALGQGQIALGADRSRGYGQGTLAVDWRASRYREADRLLHNLQSALRSDTDLSDPFTEEDAQVRLQALDRWLFSMMRPTDSSESP